MKKKETATETAGGGAQMVIQNVANLPLANIRLSELNPRKNVDEKAQAELVESIRVNGLLQPITVRPIKDLLDANNQQVYEIVCGERRYRAFVTLEAKEITSIVRDLDDKQAFDLMITENLQREDINPLDEAAAYRTLIEHDNSVTELATRFGKSEKYIRGRLNLNQLIPELKDCLTKNQLTLGAALELSKMTMEQQLEFYDDFTDLSSSTDSIPVGLSSVQEFLDDKSTSLDNVTFLDAEGNEDWNSKGECAKCKNCPFNSASQGSLFPDMVKGKNCLNEACYHDKVLAYAKWYLQFHRGAFLGKNEDIHEGCIVLCDPGYYYGGEEKKKNYHETIEELSKELKIIKGYPNYSAHYPKKGEQRAANTFKMINLSDLFNGDDPVHYYLVPAPKDDAPKEKTHYDIYASLCNLREKHRNEMREALRPLVTGALEVLTKSDGVLQEFPTLSDGVVGYALIKDMSWNGTEELNAPSPLTIKFVLDWIKEHSFTELLTAYIKDVVEHDTALNQANVMEHVISTLTPAAADEALAAVREKFQPKEQALIEQLRQMGYDEYDRELVPAEGGESESQQEPEPESES